MAALAAATALLMSNNPDALVAGAAVAGARKVAGAVGSSIKSGVGKAFGYAKGKFQDMSEKKDFEDKLDEVGVDRSGSPSKQEKPVQESTFVKFKTDLFKYMQQITGISSKQLDMAKKEELRTLEDLAEGKGKKSGAPEKEKKKRSVSDWMKLLGLTALGSLLGLAALDKMSKALNFDIDKVVGDLKSAVVAGAAIRVAAKAAPTVAKAAGKGAQAAKVVAARVAAKVEGASYDKKGMKRGPDGKFAPGTANAPSQLPGTKPAGAPTKVPGGAAKGGAKNLGKAVSKVVGKSIAKIAAKSLPFGIGAVIGTALAAGRVLSGDMVGAALEFTAGATAFAPGIGSAVSLTASAASLARDVYQEAYGVFPEDDPSPDRDKRMKEIPALIAKEIEKLLKKREVSKEEMKQISDAGQAVGAKLSGRGKGTPAERKAAYEAEKKQREEFKASGGMLDGKKVNFKEYQSGMAMKAKAAEIQAAAPKAAPTQDTSGTPTPTDTPNNLAPVPETADTQQISEGGEEGGGGGVNVVNAAPADAGTDMGGNTTTQARLAAQKKGSEKIKMDKLFARGSKNPDLTFTKARNSMYA